MHIDENNLNAYSREQLENMKMVIDIAKVIHDMQMDKQRYENERMERQAQLDAEAEERKVRIAKMQAEIDEAIKKTKYYPSIAVLTVMLSFAGAVIGSLITAWI